MRARKYGLGVAVAGLALALLVGAVVWRHLMHNRPPPPSELAVQLAGKMVGDYFQAPGSGLKLPYRLYVPQPLDPQRKYPLVVYLHGAGDNGNENLRQLGPMVSRLIDLSRSTEPAFILAPQAPWGQNWVAVPGAPYLNYSQQTLPESEAIRATRALVAQLPDHYPIDTDREYLLGFSAGSAGSWDLLTRTAAQPFAAAATLSGAYDPSRAPLLARMPLWFFHGELDKVSPYSTTLDTVQALRQAGGAPRYTLIPGVGHDTADAAFQAGVYPWLLGQRRSSWAAAASQAPAAQPREPS